MPQLSVIKASAGSGKTFRLTLEYLKLILENGHKFRHILAVTFTNKATYEMKERILENLYLLANGYPSPYREILEKDLGISSAALQQKASLTIQFILHDYARFSVETIDTFFQRLIRAFTREMGLNAGYRIELNTKLVLHEAVSNLLGHLQENNWLKNWLVDFAESRVADGKNWEIKDSISNLGNQVFNEAFKNYATNIRQTLNQEGFLKSYQAELYAIVKSYENDLSTMGQKALDVMQEHHLSVNDFSYTNAGVAGFFQKITQGQFNIGSRVEQALDNPEKWHTAKSDKKAEITGLVNSHLNQLLHEVIQYMQNNGVRYNTSKTILENLYTLGLLSSLMDEMEAYCRSEDLFLISDTAYFLNGIIGNNDAPFIYEKAGHYFHHFMIDEFQDTSGMQYANFLPLLQNSLAEGANNLLVGDVKQSIYRWRNSDWEIFEYQVNADYGHNVKTESLNTNWRSWPEVVEFNNAFFGQTKYAVQQFFEADNESIAEKMNDILSTVYADVVQQPAKSKKESNNGYVEINIPDNDQHDPLDILVENIKKLQDNGYRAGDMAILTRKKQEARNIVEHLLKQDDEQHYNFSVISNEALLIGYSSAVKLVMASLHYAQYPDDNLNAFELAYFYHALCGNEQAENHPLYQTGFTTEKLPRFLPTNVISGLNALRGTVLVEAIEKLFTLYNLHRFQDERIYLNRLLDWAAEFQERKGSDLYIFLEQWQEERENITVTPSDNQDAITVLTVHKSKGLEFKAVFVPFCNWPLDHATRPILWVEPKSEPSNRLSRVPVVYKKDLLNTDFADDYRMEKLKAYIDNINLMYVAFTRASEVLMVTAPAATKKAKSVKEVIAAVASEMEKNGALSHPSDNHFIAGQLPVKTDIKHVTEAKNQLDNYYETLSWKDRIKIAYQGKAFFTALKNDGADTARSHGQVMHELFARVHTFENIHTAINQLIFEGKLAVNEAEVLEKDIKQRIEQHETVKSWFHPGLALYSERSIYDKHGNAYRPDRVVVNDQCVQVIDYKFGESPSASHHNQVKQYMQLLQVIHKIHVRGYIWYYALNRVEEVKFSEPKPKQQTLW